jgi:hypothetical protein
MGLGERLRGRAIPAQLKMKSSAFVTLSAFERYRSSMGRKATLAFNFVGSKYTMPTGPKKILPPYLLLFCSNEFAIVAMDPRVKTE